MSRINPAEAVIPPCDICGKCCDDCECDPGLFAPQTPTPTDPREVQSDAWSNLLVNRMFAGRSGHGGTDGVVYMQMRRNALREVAKQSFDAGWQQCVQEANSKLAAEIAELKAERDRLLQERDDALELRDAAQRGREVAINERRACHDLYDQILVLCGYDPKGGYPGIVGAVDKTLATLRAELEAARKERDERKADLKMFMEMHDTALAAKDAAEKRVVELISLFSVPKKALEAIKADMLKDGKVTGRSQRQGEDALWIINAALPTESQSTTNHAGISSPGPADLTPAPTQEPPATVILRKLVEWDKKHPKGRIYPIGPNDAEKQLDAIVAEAAAILPPAGGVTISNDSSRVEGHAEAEGRPGYMGNAQPSEYQASPAVTSSTSPADVPSEGRGELLPFDLDAALGGAEMITRDGTPAKDFRRIEGKAPFPKYPYEATVNDTVYSYTGKGKFFDPYEEALDLFMLPTEGSGA